MLSSATRAGLGDVLRQLHAIEGVGLRLVGARVLRAPPLGHHGLEPPLWGVRADTEALRTDVRHGATVVAQGRRRPRGGLGGRGRRRGLTERRAGDGGVGACHGTIFGVLDRGKRVPALRGVSYSILPSN